MHQRTSTPLPTVPPTATPTPTPVPGPAKLIIIPKVNLYAPVVESALKDGAWEVPKFAAGHLQGTANPGQGSNVALSGHVESISSGNVFAHLDQLRPGDRIYLRTDREEFLYVVTKTLVVRNTDLSIVQPTSQDQVTLITCTGNWLPTARDFDQRRVVLGVLQARAPLPRK